MSNPFLDILQNNKNQVASNTPSDPFISPVKPKTSVLGSVKNFLSDTFSQVKNTPMVLPEVNTGNTFTPAKNVFSDILKNVQQPSTNKFRDILKQDADKIRAGDGTPNYQNLKDLAQGPSMFLGQFANFGLGFLSSVSELATGKPLPKVKIPALTENMGNFVDSSSNQQKYADAITAGIEAKNKAMEWANMPKGDDEDINKIIDQYKEIASKSDEDIAKEAYKDILTLGIIDAIMFAGPIKSGLKFGISKLAPNSFIDSSITNISKDAMRDYFSGKKTPAELNFTPEITKKITEKMSVMTTPEKVKFLQGFDLLNAKPSFVGKMFGVTEQEAKALLDSYGGQIRETPTAQLPGTRDVPGQAPAFGLSTRAVESVGGAAENRFASILKSPEGKVSPIAEKAPITQAGAVKPNINTPLVEEAKKYKSAEEFIKSKGEPLFHATRDTKMKEFDTNYDYESHNNRTDVGQVRDYETPYGRVFLTNNLQEAKVYGENVLDTYFKGKPKITTVKTGEMSPSQYFDEEYNWGNLMEVLDDSDVLKLVNNKGKATYVVSPENLITKSQLEKIFNDTQVKPTTNILREGQEPIGNNNVTEIVARERFDIPKLEKLSFGGSDRDVYDLGDGKVLKVAKTARGLDQNSSEGEPYAPVPKMVEQGKNYVVVEKAEKPNARTKELVKILTKNKSFSYGRSLQLDATDMINKTAQHYFDIGDEEMGNMIQDLNNYEVMINDLTSIRNWGTIDGEPVLLDAGTLKGSTIDAYKGKQNMSDPEFRDAYNQSKIAKKKFGDTDSKTMYDKRPIFKQDKDITPEEAKKVIRDSLKKAGWEGDNLRIIFDDIENGGGRLGSYGESNLGKLITLFEEEGKVGLITALHESKHLLFSLADPAIQREALNMAKKEMGPMYKKDLEIRYKEKGKYAGPGREDALLEEYIVDRWARSEASSDFGLKKSIWLKIFDALDKVFKKIRDTFKDLKATYESIPNKQGGFAKISKDVTEADRLIAEGKIRVVRQGTADVYQYKQGKNWVNARNEDSAVKQVTREPKAKVYSRADQEKIDYNTAMLEEVRTRLAEHPARPLLKFMKEGDFQDFKNPNLAKSKYEADRIIARTKKIELEAQKAFQDRPELSDKFDDPDTIRDVIADYRYQRQVEKNLLLDKKALAEIKTIQKETSPVLSQKKLEPIDISTGEGRSIEIQAQEALGVLDSEPVGLNVSLPHIIENTVTNVKSKVHFWDTWMTTPHFVMEKIGFGKEADMLRDSMDAYWKELPKNQEVITKWSEQVSKEGNKNIFRFLDGEAITLNPEEKKVALEIKDWLKEWAVKLKLPEDNQISHYITHIFDKELLAKEFDEDLAKIIADRIPGQVYDPFLLKRLGAKGYKQNTWAALDAYVKRGTRKIHLDPVLEQIRNKAGSTLDVANIEKSQWKYINKYIDNINMRPTESEESIDNLIKSIFGYKFGQRPITQMLRVLRQMTFRGMLGLNPSSALRNLSQGINTYAVLGEKNTAIGYIKLFSKGAGEELIREGVLNAGFVQDRVLTSAKKALEKFDKVLFAFFETAEKINRGAAYFGAKSKALNEGMSEDQAIKYAKSIVRKTQFVFDSVDTPIGLSSTIAKTLSQFQTFTTKQIEFLVNMAKDKNFAGLLRYALAGIAFVYTVGRAFGMKPEELIPMFRFGNDRLFGVPVPVSLKAPATLVGAITDQPDKFGQPRDLKKKATDVGNSLIGLIPAGSQMKKTYEGIMAVNEGGSFDKGGKLQFSQGQSVFKKAQSVLFGKYASEEAQNYFNKSELNSEELAKAKPIYDEAKQLVLDGKEAEAQALIDQLTDEEYALYKKYKTAETAKATVQGKKDILPKYLEIKNLTATDPEEAKKMLDALTDQEYKYYDLVRKQVEKDQKASEGTKPTFTEGETTTTRGLLATVSTYAKALGTDPLTAFNRIFTGQIIRRVDNGAIIVERMPFLASTKVKKERGFTGGTMKLDHTIPLELGGSNADDNLNLVTEEQWKSYTPVENYLASQLKQGKMSKKEVQTIIQKFKQGQITAAEAMK